MYTAAVAATLTNDITSEALGLKNSVTELMSERSICTELEISALVLDSIRRSVRVVHLYNETHAE